MRTTLALLIALPLAGCLHAPGSFSVLSYNVNYRLTETDRPRPPGEVVAAIRDADADLVCLQETNPEWERLLRDGLGDRYGHWAIEHDAHPAGGMMVLARRPIRKLAVARSDAGYWPALLVEADTPAGPVHLLNVHLLPGVHRDGSISFGNLAILGKRHHDEIVDVFAGCRLAPRPDVPLIVAGDFNEEPTGWACRWLTDGGLCNAMSRFNPDAPTWRWPTRAGAELTARLDHIFHCEKLTCESADVVESPASDHRPVIARFRARR
jgi:endonuclease/exonuclease/phosphatase family metal-dependent hydrolase